jgi:hypothetical protein
MSDCRRSGSGGVSDIGGGLGFRNGAADHAGAWFAGDEKHGVLRRGANVMANLAASAEIGIDAGLAHFC